MAVDTEEEDMVAEAVGEVMGVIVVAEVVDGVEGTVAVGAEEVVEEDMGVIHRIDVLQSFLFSLVIQFFYCFFI